MILKRELYETLPWYAWFRFRLSLAWMRTLRPEELVRDLVMEEKMLVSGRRPRALPRPSSVGLKTELLAAWEICPTRAFTSDVPHKKIVLRPSACILCGLCYDVAPSSLIPSEIEEEPFAGSACDPVDFPWT